MKQQLTEEELRTLINLVAQANVQVAQAQPLINLINKMSQMIDQLRMIDQLGEKSQEEAED